MGVTDKILSVTGLSWQELVAKGFARLVSEIDGEKATLQVLQDGIRINIVCDEESKREAAELWTNHIQPELEGED